jgi:kynurenine formamidase
LAEEWFPSKWGADDELGALNEISPSKIIDAAKLVRKGKAYNLAQLMENGIPQNWIHGPFLYATFRRHEDCLRLYPSENKIGFMNLRLEIADHSGTHIDSLNHASIDGRVYNGLEASRITDMFGTSKLGIDRTPLILTRGILIDVAGYKNREILEDNYVISAEEIEAILNQNNVKLNRGDALLIATGWSKLWMMDNEKYAETCPGIGLSAARWIAQQGVSIVGADTWNVEVSPCEDPKESCAVHQALITKNGIRMIENMNLQQLCQDRVWEFLFVCLPLYLKGGTGSPVTPIAVS